MVLNTPWTSNWRNKRRAATSLPLQRLFDDTVQEFSVWQTDFSDSERSSKKQLKRFF